MKTIRQIADEIGVSKTAVNKQIANLGLRSGLRKNGNQFAIDEHQEALIKQAFSEKSQTEIENQSQTKTQTENHEVGDLVCVLQATIDTLQGQLEVKDRQIAKLTEALVAAQQTAAAAQALHAGTMKQQLQQKIPSMKEKLKEAQERKRLENENRQLKVQVEYLEKDLSWERGISARLQEGIGAVLDFLDQHLPEQFRPLVEKARELLPVPEVQQPEREQERGHTWGGMER